MYKNARFRRTASIRDEIIKLTDCSNINDVYLVALTDYMLNNWNDDHIFIMWLELFFHRWYETLPRLLKRRGNLEDIKVRVNADPRFKLLNLKYR